MNIDRETIGQVFTYHAPADDQVERYRTLRASAAGQASLILDCCPPSRERSVALTKLQEVVMWANASIAINEADGASEGETPGQAAMTMQELA